VFAIVLHHVVGVLQCTCSYHRICGLCIRLCWVLPVYWYSYSVYIQINRTFSSND